MTSGRVSRDTPYFRRYDRESAGFETADFVTETFGGATVVRLRGGSLIFILRFLP